MAHRCQTPVTTLITFPVLATLCHNSLSLYMYRQRQSAVHHKDALTKLGIPMFPPLPPDTVYKCTTILYLPYSGCCSIATSSSHCLITGHTTSSCLSCTCRSPVWFPTPPYVARESSARCPVTRE